MGLLFLSKLFHLQKFVVFSCIIFICVINGSQSRRYNKNNKMNQNTPIRPYPMSRLCDEDNGTNAPYRYHKETKECYVVGTKGPCKDMMLFTMVDNDYGMCDCDIYRQCGRSMIYWPHTDRCYLAYSQGPCTRGKIFSLGHDLKPVCKKNGCQSEESRSPSNSLSFWYRTRGKCYKTHSQGYCSREQVLHMQMGAIRPSCLSRIACHPKPIFPKVSCAIGSVLSYYDKCPNQNERYSNQFK